MIVTNQSYFETWLTSMKREQCLSLINIWPIFLHQHKVRKKTFTSEAILFRLLVFLLMWLQLLQTAESTFKPVMWSLSVIAGAHLVQCFLLWPVVRQAFCFKCLLQAPTVIFIKVCHMWCIDPKPWKVVNEQRWHWLGHLHGFSYICLAHTRYFD